jgi:hypothetical protein
MKLQSGRPPSEGCASPGGQGLDVVTDLDRVHVTDYVALSGAGRHHRLGPALRRVLSEPSFPQ